MLQSNQKCSQTNIRACTWVTPICVMNHLAAFKIRLEACDVAIWYDHLKHLDTPGWVSGLLPA